jgi:hypothetical protein
MFTGVHGREREHLRGDQMCRQVNVQIGGSGKKYFKQRNPSSFG